MHIPILLTFLTFSCSVPDLADRAVLEDAKKDAIDLKSLERKLMYGMLYLWVEEEGKPFTGWAKSTGDQNKLLSMGYLLDGRKEGLWISWDENGTKMSEIYWTEDRMDGPFVAWHSNGRIKAIGQTEDGEMNGKWTEYYASGHVASRSLNKLGHLDRISVWHPNGSVCEQSIVKDGNGTFTKYLEDGRIEYVRTFEKVWKHPENL